MTSRTIAALRRLAERPGTEHEGAVARAMLEKAEGQRGEWGEAEAAFRAYMRGEKISMADLVNALDRAAAGGD